MYGWGGTRRRAYGTADADNPTEATIERRRASDLAFLEVVKTGSLEELVALLAKSRGWRLVALQRALLKCASSCERKDLNE